MIMVFFKNLCVLSLVFLSLISHRLVHAALFEVQNNCPYTVWAAAVPGGGRMLNTNDVWSFDVNPGTTGGRVWGRTNCNFDGSGRGGCQTGDCNGLLECQGYGQPPNMLAEFALNQFSNLDIS